MSEFDKEAERERLREKFAAEEADRAVAQHMSELLLQGMTMTDRHCPECGAPLFRDEEHTFCPECEREVVEGAVEGESQEAPPKDSTQPATKPTVQPTGDARSNIEATLERSAAAAATAEDPRTAREHLETAKAAIEALRSFDGE